MDKELIELNYESSIFSLAHGLDPDLMIEVMNTSAEENDFEIAEGMRLALVDYLSSVGKHNCKIKPIISFELPDYD